MRWPIEKLPHGDRRRRRHIERIDPRAHLDSHASCAGVERVGREARTFGANNNAHSDTLDVLHFPEVEFPLRGQCNESMTFESANDR